MNYKILACDYDGTLAKDGVVSEKTLRSLKRLNDSGVKLLLVTGREMDDLKKVFNNFEIFQKIIAENGAMIFDPRSKETKLLGSPPSKEFIELAEKKGIDNYSAGNVIYATWKPYEKQVIEVIRDLGMELQIIFNKDAVMVLPAGLNKAAGLKAALKIMNYSPHNVVGIGDAENDHAFLELCELSAAVKNSIPTLKDAVDYVTESTHGEGVSELIEMILKKEYTKIKNRNKKSRILFGWNEKKEEIDLPAAEKTILITGSSGGGKTTTAAALLEQLSEKEYQFCLIDPEGDYSEFENAVTSGGTGSPAVENILEILNNPKQNCIVNMTHIPLQERPAFFQQLLPELSTLRSTYGRPHFVIVDETHHLLPESTMPVSLKPEELKQYFFITVKPGHVADFILNSADVVLGIGAEAREDLKEFSNKVRRKLPEIPAGKYQSYLWQRDKRSISAIAENVSPKVKLKRHIKKYAEGDLGDDKSFIFSGPGKKLKLKAQNLMMFIQIAEGIDDETWVYHLNKNEYSEWFRKIIKDGELAEEIKKIEENKNLRLKHGKDLIINKIKELYTGQG